MTRADRLLKAMEAAIRQESARINAGPPLARATFTVLYDGEAIRDVLPELKCAAVRV